MKPLKEQAADFFHLRTYASQDTDNGKPTENWFKELLWPDRRRAARHRAPRLEAYYWDGAAPASHAIRDISRTGLYLLTEERWHPGTLVTMTLQKTGSAEDSPERSITVHSKVVRWGPDGVGLVFISPKVPASERGPDVETNAADKKTLERFVQRLQRDEGHALVEYILLLPLLSVLIVNVVILAGLFLAWIAAEHAAPARAASPLRQNHPTVHSPQRILASIDSLRLGDPEDERG